MSVQWYESQERRRVAMVGEAAYDYQQFVKACHKELHETWCAGMTGTGVVIWFPNHDTDEKLAPMHELDYKALAAMDFDSLCRWVCNTYDEAHYWHRVASWYE